MASTPRILIALLTDRQDYQHHQEAEARAAAAEAGFEVEVIYAENSPVVQAQRLHARVAVSAEKRPAAIVVELAAGAGFERVARAAVEAGIGWVVISARVPHLEALQRQHPASLICCVVTDDEEIGRIQASPDLLTYSESELSGLRVTRAPGRPSA